MLDTMTAIIAKFGSDRGAKMKYAAVTFEVGEVRLLIDFG